MERILNEIRSVNAGHLGLIPISRASVIVLKSSWSTGSPLDAGDHPEMYDTD